MVKKKDLITVVLGTFCLTATLFLIISSRSVSPSETYDPSIDLNNDGNIDILDAIILANHFGTSGTPIVQKFIPNVIGIDLICEFYAFDNLFNITGYVCNIGNGTARNVRVHLIAWSQEGETLFNSAIGFDTTRTVYGKNENNDGDMNAGTAAYIDDLQGSIIYPVYSYTLTVEWT